MHEQILQLLRPQCTISYLKCNKSRYFSHFGYFSAIIERFRVLFISNIQDKFE